MQPIRNIWTSLVGDHPGIIPVKFGQNPMSGFRGEDVYVNKRAQRALGRSPEEKVIGHSVDNNREPQGHNLNKLTYLCNQLERFEQHW